LGVLLALISLVPFFIIVIFLLSGDEGDKLEFDESSRDSSFVGSFKHSFNVVFKIGIAVLWIACIIIGIAAGIAFLYAEYGIIGFALGILVVALIIWLLAILGQKLSNVFFPGYRS